MLFDCDWLSGGKDSCSIQFKLVIRKSLFNFFRFSLIILNRNFFAFSFSKGEFFIEENEAPDGSVISFWSLFNSSSLNISIKDYFNIRYFTT